MASYRSRYNAVVTFFTIDYWQLHFSQREMKRRKSVMDGQDYCSERRTVKQAGFFVRRHVAKPLGSLYGKYIRDWIIETINEGLSQFLICLKNERLFPDKSMTNLTNYSKLSNNCLT